MNMFGWSVRWCRPLTTLSAVAFCQTNDANSKVNEKPPIKVELKQSMAEQLTHKYLLQQTCTMSVNASCQMITIALVALTDASQKYKNELIKLMDVLENDQLIDGDALENILVDYQSSISEAKTFYLDSVSAMDVALQLGQSSGNMSFVVQANTVLNIISERFDSAKKEFQSCIEDTKKVEDKFAKVFADTIEKSNNPK